MAPRSDRSIWALLQEAAGTLPEPFSRAALIAWVSGRRPDLEESSISTHIAYATVETPNRSSHPLGKRAPFLTRVDRGVYRRLATADMAPVTPTPADVPAQAAPSAVPSRRIVLVGCSRTKQPDAAPAGELFEGALFRRARDHAIRSGDDWFVLSAKFGLLDPAEMIEPYDLYLADRSPSYRSAWGEWVVAQLAERVPLAGLDVEVHAGDAYCAPLREPVRRAGARLGEPLAGLRQGERLAWAGYRDVPDAVPPTGVEVLLDPSRPLSPEVFLARGNDGLTTPGLYTWWVDEDGAADLARGMGHPVAAGLLYAGKAGGHRAGATPSTATLWGRVVGNHLRGNVRSSTFRQSLAALLGADGQPVTEDQLSTWMLAHLRVATLPVGSEDVARLEDQLVAQARPPLNLSGLARDEARGALSRLRSRLRGEPSARNPSASADERGTQVDVVRALEQRVRTDLAAVLAAGYRPTIFQRMLAEHGAVGTARQLLAAPQMSGGFRWLWEHRMLRHAIEHAVLDEAFAPLFTAGELETAEQRLRDVGFSG